MFNKDVMVNNNLKISLNLYILNIKYLHLKIEIRTKKIRQ